VLLPAVKLTASASGTGWSNGVTVALKVTLSPKLAGLGVALAFVEVASAVTVWFTLPLWEPLAW
jgi:hypothetical protein